jgi:hypothetical protein
MHEVLVTRGHAAGLPFRRRALIHVSCNVVLVHEPICHEIAQHELSGKAACTSQILKYHSLEEIRLWSEYVDPNDVMEVKRWLRIKRD